MLHCNRVCLILVLWALALCEEHTNHGPSIPHMSDGEHNADFDHQAVLGSEDLDEEFEGLHPAEARSRLQKLVKEHDLDTDGQISKDEMYKWIVSSFLKLDREEAMEKFEEEDDDKNERVSWQEYLNKVYSFTTDDVEEMRITVRNADDKTDEVRDTESSLKLVDEDQRFFQAADQNGDGSLDPDEYMAFFFPPNYEHMHKLEMDRYMSQNDADGDGRISKTEFMPEGMTDDESRISAKDNFADFDKDKDGFLSTEEVKEWVVPNTDELAEDEANHLIVMADTNGDKHLSMEEILDKTDQFVGSSITDYGNFLRHDEL